MARYYQLGYFNVYELRETLYGTHLMCHHLRGIFRTDQPLLFFLLKAQRYTYGTMLLILWIWQTWAASVVFYGVPFHSGASCTSGIFHLPNGGPPRIFLIPIMFTLYYTSYFFFTPSSRVRTGGYGTKVAMELGLLKPVGVGLLPQEMRRYQTTVR